MRFGLLCTAQGDSADPAGGSGAGGPGAGFREFLDFNVEAEGLGFHSTFLVEHHFSGWNQVSSTLMLLGCLAMRTTTIRLGTAVMVLPWHNPVLLAEQVATLDLVSDGRLDFGIGKGYRHSEFTGFQVAPDQAPARFDESLEVMLRAWTTRARFSHRGRWWRFENIVVEPPPRQQPHPPIWVEDHALYGTPDEILSGLAALQDHGAACVLVNLEPRVDQLKRFARDVTPGLAA